ncbi:MAG: PEP-CTERM system TPR-repeat protein PrsT [Gemmatimonadaceae bacterium]|nr:PEP-CTERM system TPR-repeat protein PrsT [Acetobacteraceae bacterium]
MKKLLIGLAVVTVLGAGAGGGWYVFGRTGNPVENARKLLAKGDVRGAQIELRNAIKANPTAPEPHLRLAQLQLQLSDAVAAEKELKVARDLGSDPTVVTPLLAQAYLAQQRYADVLSEVKAEGVEPVEAAKLLVLRAVAQIGMENPQAARISLNEAQRLAPDNLEAPLTMARVAVVERNFKEAEALVDKALMLNDKRADSLLLKGQLLSAKNEPAAAMDYFERAVAAAPNSSGIRMERANQYLVIGQDAKARLDVDKVLATEPRNAAAVYLDMVLLVRTGRYAEADIAAEKLAPVLTRFPRGQYFQALIKSNLGQIEQAVDAALRYVARAPDDLEGVRLLARIELAAKRPERAIAALQKAVDAGFNDAETMDLMGRAYSVQGKPAEAARSFQEATTLAPLNSDMLTRLASTRMQMGDTPGATAALERSLDLKPGQANAGEALVAAALSSGDAEKAKAALERLRQQVGNTESVGVLDGMVKLAGMDIEGARAQFAATAQQFPQSSIARVNLAKVLILLNRRSEAEGVLNEMLAKNRADPEALTTLIGSLLQENKLPQAVVALEAARAVAPTNVGLTAALVDIHVRNKEPKRGLAVLQQARSTGALPPQLMVAQARAQAADGDTAAAKTTYRQILAGTPNELEVRRALVELALNTGDTAGARDALREGLKLSPGNLGMMTALIITEQRQSGTAAALALADELRRDPANMPAASVIKGDAYMAARRYGDAAATFSAEMKLTPSTGLVLRTAGALAAAGGQEQAAQQLRSWMEGHPDDADAAQMLASLDITNGRGADAERNLGIVLKQRPNDAIALNNLAWVYQLKGDRRARGLAQRAHLLAPTGETADTLGWILTREGAAAEGLPLLQLASTQRPNDKSVQFHLATALGQTGRREEALKVLDAIIAEPGDFDERGPARTLAEQLRAAK